MQVDVKCEVVHLRLERHPVQQPSTRENAFKVLFGSKEVGFMVDGDQYTTVIGPRAGAEFTGPDRDQRIQACCEWLVARLNGQPLEQS